MRKLFVLAFLTLASQLVLADNSKVENVDLNDQFVLATKLYTGDSVTVKFTRDFFVEKGLKDVFVQGHQSTCGGYRYLVSFKQAKNNHRIILKDTSVKLSVDSSRGTRLVADSHSQIDYIYINSGISGIYVSSLKFLFGTCNSGLSLTNVEFTTSAQAEVIK